MKRLIPLLLAAMLLLTACTAASAPFIAPAALTKQETDILKLAGVEPEHFFDVVTPEGARSMTVRARALQSGEWSPHGGTIDQLDGKSHRARIALSFDLIGEGLRTAVQIDGKDASAVAVTKDVKIDINEKMVGTTTLSDKKPIVLNEEITLVTQVISDGSLRTMQGEVDRNDPEMFAGYEQVYVITVLFSDEPPESIE